MYVLLLRSQKTQLHERNFVPFKLHWDSPSMRVCLFYDINKVNFTMKTLWGEVRDTLYLQDLLTRFLSYMTKIKTS